MRIELCVVGKTGFDYIKDGMAIYQKRLKRYVNFDLHVIPDIKNAKNLSSDQIKKAEGEKILKHLQKDDFLVLLDEKGKQITSVDLSKWIAGKMMDSNKKIIFQIGGAYGFSEEVYSRANFKLGLSKMTFSHQMIRLFVVEQIYRAFSIIRNEPYHNI